jgi:glycosyltransferase involved in cell wall biosynthesis
MRHHGGILLVGPRSDGALVGGIETGIEMLLRSDLYARRAVAFWNTSRQRDAASSAARRLLDELVEYGRFVVTLARTRPRLVHVKAAEGTHFFQGLVYVVLARLGAARVLLQIHGGSFDAWYASLPAVGRAIIRLGLRVPHEILVLSDYWRSLVARLYPRGRIHVVPNGVETERALARRNGARDVVCVVTLGALGERKGHFDIVEAAALLRDAPVRFLFAGPDEFGGEGAALEARIAALGLSGRVRLLGAVTGEAKWRLLADADVFLLPSRGENMPNALLEAMAAELPVICTDVGAMREMVGDAGARIIPAGSPHALAESLAELLRDPERRAAMGAMNRRRAVERYSMHRVVGLLDGLYA